MKSPGAHSRACAVVHFPSQRTLASIASLALRAAMAVPAWYSSQGSNYSIRHQENKRIMKKSDQWRQVQGESRRPLSSRGSEPELA